LDDKQSEEGMMPLPGYLFVRDGTRGRGENWGSGTTHSGCSESATAPLEGKERPEALEKAL